MNTNKKGAANIIGLIFFILFVWAIIGAFQSITDPEICVPLKNHYQACVKNESLVLKGAIKDDLSFVVGFQDQKISCAVEQDSLELRTVCDDIFKKALNNSEYTLELLINDVGTFNITSQDIKIATIKYFATNPRVYNKLGRSLYKNPEYLLLGALLIAATEKNTGNQQLPES